MRLNLISVLVLFIYICSASSIFDSSLDKNWSTFKKKYNKIYVLNSSEEIKRRLTWESNLKYINKHNFDASLGKHSYTLKINKYGDMTNKEFRKYMNGLKTTIKLNKIPKNTRSFEVQIPDTIDWRTKGYVTPVKDQGQCGSCWAFSAVASLEGQNFKSTGKLVNLSEQNLVDCSRDYGNMGCNGGYMDNAFKYIKENNGIDTEDSYPYEAKDGNCRFTPENVGATDTGFIDITSGDENALTNAIAEIGPISVGMDASQISFQFYSNGIYSDDGCSSTELNHGVTAVGYGKNEREDEYYIIKNSWGTSWGDQGYVLIARNKNNMCGVASAASYPLV